MLVEAVADTQQEPIKHVSILVFEACVARYNCDDDLPKQREDRATVKRQCRRGEDQRGLDGRKKRFDELSERTKRRLEVIHSLTASFYFEFRNGANGIILPRSQVFSSVLCHSQIAKMIALIPADLSQYTLKNYPEKMNSRIRRIL